jgi:outer membrane protein TolC
MAAGKGEQAEALRAQSELLKVQSDSEGVRARRVAASAKLVALLNRAPGSALGMTTEPGLVENLPTQEALRARSLRERPEFAGTQARTAQAEARLRLAKAERVPDLTIFLAEMHSFRMTGVSDFLFAGVQGNLPIFAASKNRGRIETASAQRAATHAEERALQNRIFAEIADAYAEVTAERRQIDLHHQLIPVARQALASALSAYAAGRGSFLLVLDSERDLLMHEIDLATHRAMYEQRLADLERAVGGDLGLAQAAESGSRERH